MYHFTLQRLVSLYEHFNDLTLFQVISIINISQNEQFRHDKKERF